MIKENATPEDLATIVHQKLRNAKLMYDEPAIEILQELFGQLFFTSLRTEEGQFIRVTITLIDPAKPDPKPPQRKVLDRWRYVPFKNAIPYTIKNLVKLSKAVDPWSASLAVYYNEKQELLIFGMIDQSIHYQSFLHYERPSGPEQPGLFQVSITNIGSMMVMYDYELMATLKHNILISSYLDIFRNGKIYETLKTHMKGVKEKVFSLLKKEIGSGGFDLLDGIVEITWVETLSRLLLAMQNYHHGGSIILTNDGDVDIDIKYELSYDRVFTAIVNKCKTELAVNHYSNIIHEEWLEKENMPALLYLNEAVSESEHDESEHELKGTIRFVSSLTHVDGAVIMTPELKVYGFGGIITGNACPDEIHIAGRTSITANNLSVMQCNHFGTRHRSVFSYCWHHPGSIGFIVSQDGDIRVAIKVKNKLIMWENIRVQQLIKSRKLKKNFTKISLNRAKSTK